MEEQNPYENILQDFDLLKRLIVGIGEVADITGVAQRKIRYWEEKGIIHSLKGGESSTRRYDYLNIKKIILIQELLEEGFTLDAAARKIGERMKKLHTVFTQLADQSKEE